METSLCSVYKESLIELLRDSFCETGVILDKSDNNILRYIVQSDPTAMIFNITNFLSVIYDGLYNIDDIASKYSSKILTSYIQKCTELALLTSENKNEAISFNLNKYYFECMCISNQITKNKRELFRSQCERRRNHWEICTRMDNGRRH